jgi:hypothetical protein
MGVAVIRNATVMRRSFRYLAAAAAALAGCGALLRLVYGSSSRIGGLMSAASGQALVAASRTKVRLPVCGQRFTGFVGGIIVPEAACVTFDVSSPSVRAATVSVPIGPSRC